MLTHSLAAAQRARTISTIILVLPAGEVAAGKERFSGRFPKLAGVVAGGAERQDSVRAGGEAAGECDVLVVHDAARPFVLPEMFDAVAVEASRCGAAVAAIPVSDTVKETDGSGGIVRTIDRARLVLSQTPQAFRRDLLIEALDDARAKGIVATDEAALIEGLGHPVRLVPGSRLNLKITHEEDLALARALAGEAVRTVRVGVGEDIHPLVEGRPLILGGVEIPFERGLAGHSDGDALVHAIIDALCGAAALPNIGELFPDDDPAWRGASSLEMLRLVGRRLRDEGWQVENLDSVVLCDRPRLSVHLPEMRQRIADALEASRERVGIKGKSAEGLGPEGAGHAISARAVALLGRTGVSPVEEAV
jgi:2-C-methyl-D-erythritol 4-phosphate cytidylyltransferase/2-C-methyl-D-erythritol 2,4-cyclodiphosphate synthase